MGRLAAHRADPKLRTDPKPRAASSVPGNPAGAARRGSGGRTIFTGRSVTTAVLLAVGLLASRLWLVEPVTVSSESMEPALPKGSTVLMFKPGPVLGVLIAGIAVGQLEVPVSEALKDTFFMLFLFAVGSALVVARRMGFDAGAPAGSCRTP